jgi:drug/metabolite transporter (DMT)-like permease
MERQLTSSYSVRIRVLGGITVLWYDLWDAAMRQGNLPLVASASYLTPLLSTLVSCVYLAVIPGAQLWIGCALIIAGSLVSWRSVKSD